jgi:hypothetical protein
MERRVHRLLVGNPEGMRPLGRPRRKWKYNIKIDFQELDKAVVTGWIWIRIGTVDGLL